MNSPASSTSSAHPRLDAAGDNPLRFWPDSAYDRPYLRQKLMFRRLILLSAPEAVRHVLVGNVRNYRRTSASIRLLRPLAGRGLLLAEGERWRQQRKVIAPTLAPRAMPMLMSHAAAAVADWEDALAPRAAAGPLDLLQQTQALALDIAGRAMFSVDLGPFAAEMRALLEGPGLSVSRPTLPDMILPAFIPSPRDLRRFLFRRRWMGLIDRIIARRAATPPAAEAQDLFDLLRAATGSNDPTRDKLLRDEVATKLLRDEVATLIIAGHETTALTLFWTAVLLADRPDVQVRIAAEAAGTDLSPGAASAALEHLPYTRAVISEGLRLYPPAAIIAREAIADDEAGGIAIRAGTRVIMAPWVMHRHRALWRDPERFDPSRFLDDGEAIDRFAYLPFGAGPRVCVGAAFAMAEATLALASLVRRHEISLAGTQQVRPVVVITTHPDHAPLFNLRPRTGG